jgi:hypothetical protein
MLVKLCRVLKEHWLLTLLAAVLAVVYLLEIAHGLPNRDEVWAYDSWPLIPLIMAKKTYFDGWNTGWYDSYPPFHRHVLLCFLVPYMAVQYGLGNLAGLKMDGGYPYGLKDFDTIFMHLAIITRVVSAVMAVGTAYWTYRIGKALLSERAGFFSAAIIGLAPAVVYYVHTETLDVPMLFWLSAALYSYVRVLQTFELRFYVWLALLAVIATATKDYAYGAFVLLPLPLIWHLSKHLYQSVAPRNLLRALVDKRHLVGLATFCVAFVLLENWVWNFSGFVNHVLFIAGKDPVLGRGIIVSQLGRFDVLSPVRLATTAEGLRLVLGWIGLPVCFLGLLATLFRRSSVVGTLLWPLGSYYFFTVVQFLPANDLSSGERPFLAMALILALFGGEFLASLWEARSLRLLARAACVVLLAGLFLNGFAVDVALRDDPRYQAEAWMAKHAPEKTRIEMYGPRIELPRLEKTYQAAVLNHHRNPDYSGVLPLQENAGANCIRDRGPEYVVVSDIYLSIFRNPTGPKSLTEEDYRKIKDYFEALSNEQLGYKEVARFEPQLARRLKFRENLIPGIIVYQKAP